MLTELILDKLGVFYDDVLKKKHGSSRAYTYGEVIERILAGKNTSAYSLFPEMGMQTFNRMIKTAFPDVKLNGGNETWYYYLLKFVEHKTCSACRQVLPYTKFTKDRSSRSGLDSYCRECNSLNNKQWYSDNKEEYHQKYIDEHRSEYNARNAKRRAQRIQATPAWANEEKIKEIYRTCPKGCHVDHIYPLISDWVCGLHVESNLQHLSAEDNLRKGNKYIAGLVELADTSGLSPDASA